MLLLCYYCYLLLLSYCWSKSRKLYIELILTVCMGKIGSYDYPDTQVATLLKAVETLVLTFKGEATDEKNFASVIGHKNTKSGGYLQKVADLRKYGWIEKKGLIAT